MVKNFADSLLLPDYPNVLAEPLPNRFTLARRPLVLVGLVLLCLVPRAWIATKCSSICPDATLYIGIAKTIEDGQWGNKAITPQWIAYPAILATLHRVGFALETGARCWGVVLASLVVLPLFGWIRRQFDDRVAIAACFLYAVHPRLVEWSPSIIRDPTFWFLFVLSLYLLWRAISEVRLGFFLAAGIATTLASLIRTEGFLLIVPFTLWSICRWWDLRESRWRQAFGASMFFFAFPACLLVFGFVNADGSPSEKISRMTSVMRISKWERSIGSSFRQSPAIETPSSAQATSPIGPDQIPRMSTGKLVWEYIKVLETSVTAVFGLLLLGGIYCWRGVWARRDNQPLFFVALIIMAGIWFDYRCGQRTSTRYPLTIVLMGMPFAALSLLGISQWLREFARRFNLSARLQRIALLTPALLIVAINFSEVSTHRYVIWKSYADVGHWTRAELGRPPIIAGHEALVTVSNYYCGAQSTFCLSKRGPGAIAKIARNPTINFLLLSKRELRSFDPKGLLAELKRLGFVEVAPLRLPAGTDGILVFERKPAKRPNEAS